MKVGLVSSYPPIRCGIGTYTAHIARTLSTDGEGTIVHVAAEEGSQPQASDRLVVQPCYQRDKDYSYAVFRNLAAAGVDVVHVQHAPDPLGMDDRLPRLLQWLQESGIPSVVTLHTVYPDRCQWLPPEGRGAADFHRAVAHRAHLIVHDGETCANTLVAQGIGAERVTVIPHGTEEMALPDPLQARRNLSIPDDAVVFLHFGFIHVQKNLHTALVGFLMAARRAPQARLVVAGAPYQDHWYNRGYVQAQKLLCTAAGLRQRTVWHDQFIDSAAVAQYFAAADVVVLPHAHQPYGSASGVFHLAIGAARPVLYSREPKFREIQDISGMPAECGISAFDVPGWAHAIGRMAQDDWLRRRAAQAVRKYAQETAWSRIVARHLDLYRRVQRPPDSASTLQVCIRTACQPPHPG